MKCIAFLDFKYIIFPFSKGPIKFFIIFKDMLKRYCMLAGLFISKTTLFSNIIKIKLFF